MASNGMKIEYYRGQGPGGQHKNKTANACRVTDEETGIQSCADCRKRTESKRLAVQGLEEKVAEHKAAIKAKIKKDRRDDAIKNMKTIRTYDFKKGIVIDHRTGNRASLKNVLRKGRLDDLK